ncbi:MAG: YiiX/YebB-like N1pC/P60 family cysteine hydrolase [Vulcanimicrobiota bacterium]
MHVQSNPGFRSVRVLSQEKPPAAPPPESKPEKKKHTPIQKLRYAAFKMMDIRIPAAFPEISAETKAKLAEKIKPGDVLLTTEMSYPGWQPMEYYGSKSHYTHSAIMGADGKIYESVGGGTHAIALDDFLKGSIKVSVVRPGLNEAEIGKATDYLQANLGKPYDSHFDTKSDAKYYCSEYVGKSLLHARSELPIPIERFGNKQVIAVDSFMHTPGMQVIHDGESNYWTNKLAYWPIHASGAAGAAAGYALGHGLGAAIGGGALGVAAAIMIGNRIQTGMWAPSVHELRESKGKA